MHLMKILNNLENINAPDENIKLFNNFRIQTTYANPYMITKLAQAV